MYKHSPDVHKNCIVPSSEVYINSTQITQIIYLISWCIVWEYTFFCYYHKVHTSGIDIYVQFRMKYTNLQPYFFIFNVLVLYYNMELVRCAA